MSIHFDFTLTDTDAANLISILNDEKVRALDMQCHHMGLYHAGGGNNQVALANAEWYKAHAEYLQTLKEKVLAGHRATTESVYNADITTQGADCAK
jgi:hypothetical protein